MARILIVDDDPDMRALMDVTLRRHGHKMRAAEDPKVAVDMISNQSFDLILMDIDMPNMNGVEFTKLLRDNPSFLHYANGPIVMVTGRTDPGIMSESFDAGAVYFLQKPFETRELIDTVRLVLHTVGNQG